MKDYIDAQDDKTRAQNDARFARIETKLGVLKVPSVWQYSSIAAAAVVAFIGINGLMADRFEGGIGVSNVLDSIIKAQEEARHWTRSKARSNSLSTGANS